MSKQLFLLLAIFVMFSIAFRTLPPPDKATPELLAAGMKQEYIDQFFNFQRDRKARMLAVITEEVKTGKKGIRAAAHKKENEALKKMRSSWPAEQGEIFAKFVLKYL